MIYETLAPCFLKKEDKRKKLEEYMNMHEKNCMQEYKKIKKVAEEASLYENEPDKYKNALKVANEFNKKPKISSKDQKRAKQCVLNKLTEALEHNDIIGELTDNKGLNRETQTFFKMLDSKDAKFLIDNIQTPDETPIVIDNIQTTMKEAKQAIINKAFRNVIQLSRESRNANTPEKEIELFEKYGIQSFIVGIDLDGQKIDKILGDLKVGIDPLVLEEFNIERPHINTIDTIKSNVLAYSNPLSTKVNPGAVSLYADICNSSMEKLPKNVREEIHPIVFSNGSEKSIESSIIQFSGNATACFTPLLNNFIDGENNKYEQPIEGLKQMMVLNLVDHGYNPSVKVDKLNDLHFYNTKGEEIKESNEAFKKALDGEKIRIKNENGKYLFTIRSSIEIGGKNLEDAKHNNIDLMESVFKAKDVKANTKETINTINEFVNQTLISNLKDFESTLEASNPGYVKNQKGKDQGPYSKALSEIKSLTDSKAPKLSNQEMKEKLQNIRDLSEQYLNSKMNKGKFNSLETKRFDAMDKIYQSLSGIEEKMDKVNSIVNTLEKEIAPTREKANDKYPIDKDISENTVIQNKTIEKEKTLEIDSLNK